MGARLTKSASDSMSACVHVVVCCVAPDLPDGLRDQIQCGSFRGMPSDYDVITLVKKHISSQELAQAGCVRDFCRSFSRQTSTGSAPHVAGTHADRRQHRADGEARIAREDSSQTGSWATPDYR